MYPNPGGDRIMIRTGLKNKLFELFDINGKLCLKGKTDNLITPFNTSKLNPGIYSWRLSDNSGVYETGKWQKK